MKDKTIDLISHRFRIDSGGESVAKKKSIIQIEWPHTQWLGPDHHHRSTMLKAKFVNYYCPLITSGCFIYFGRQIDIHAKQPLLKVHSE